jgi:glucan phosphorylase
VHFRRLWALARNLWWTWHPEVVALFRDLEPIRWRQLGHNPIALLSEFSLERMEQRVNELVLRSQINSAYRRLQDYLHSDATWGATHAGVLRVRPAAYFSAEFGLHESLPIDRELTAHLYGGDNRVRIRQELLLGVGGVRALRALRALGIDPGVFHLNEGHSAFATLEVVRERMAAEGLGFEAALRQVASQTVFTTHTPVAAGHDRRLTRLINDPVLAVQLVFAGKAHPRDEPGKQLLRQVARLTADPRFAGRVVFIEDYDIDVGRHLVQGVDVWLNTPRRPLEASGTSGQKVVLNGGLNLSVLDGWWAEAYDGSNGFAIGRGRLTRTGTVPPRTSLSATLPSSSRDRPPRPCVSRAMRSAAWAWASRRMPAAGCPSTITRVCTLTPRSRSHSATPSR